MKLTIVQYGGDYRETWERFNSGGKATYQAQRYSVSFVESLAKRLEQVSVICASTESPYDEVLPNGVRAIGAGLKPGFHPRQLLPLLAGTSPDRLTLVTPMVPLLRWAQHNRIRTLATLADSFEESGVLARIRFRKLATYLNASNVDWVGNHGISACLSLIRIGVDAEKVIPWDWPPSHKPTEYPSRSLNVDGTFKILFVGSVTEEKGVGDLLSSVGRLRDQGKRVSLTIVGNGPTGRIRTLAESLELKGIVQLAGVVPNDDIPEWMRAAQAVVIPSHHEYPEGLPLTIYESLASRTPIIASDHPMFKGALLDGVNALIFPAGNVDALADAISRLSDDADLYARLSENSVDAWKALQLPVVWGELIERWLSDSPSDREWLSEHRVTSGKYNQQISARVGKQEFRKLRLAI